MTKPSDTTPCFVGAARGESRLSMRPGEPFLAARKSSNCLLTLIALLTLGCPEKSRRPAEPANDTAAIEQAAKSETANAEATKAQAREDLERRIALVPGEVFVTLLREGKEAYAYAPESTSKQAAYERTRQVDATFFSKIGNKVVDWEGEFEELPDPKNADEILRFNVPKKGAFHVELRGVGRDGNFNGLQKTSPVFKAITKIGAGACASVSGSIDPKEKSATNSGAMEEPEYNLIFESVRPCKAQRDAVAAGDSNLRSLPPAENLATARSALSDGYDAKRRIGGRLDDAERALNAVADDAPQAADAKKLLAEIGERRDREHLEAARAAMADGHDPKSGLGGNLDVAKVEIDAISRPTDDVKRVSLELASRFERAKYNAKAAALVAEKARDATFAFKGGQLVVTITSASGGTLHDLTLSGHSTLANLAGSGFDEIPELQAITVVEMGEWEDARGNDQKGKVGEFMVTRKTAKTVNWERVRTSNVLKLIDKAWMAPGPGGYATE